MLRVFEITESHGMGGGKPPTDDIEVVSGGGASSVEDGGGGKAGVGYAGGGAGSVEDLGGGSRESDKVGTPVPVLMDSVMVSPKFGVVVVMVARRFTASWGGIPHGNVDIGSDSVSLVLAESVVLVTKMVIVMVGSGVGGAKTVVV